MKKIKEMFKPKTNQREVFDWIVRYQKISKGEIPRGRLIGRVFNVSAERGNQYRRAFVKKLDNLKNNN